MPHVIRITQAYPYLVLVGIYLVSVQPKCFATSSQTRRIDPGIQKQIDDFIDKTYLPGSQISGLGLSIVQNDGELLYTTGYGLANIEKGIPVRNSTQFLLGSVTKSFTAVLMVKLLHENFPALGEAVLDTPIRKLLPQTNFTLIDQFRSEQATFRDLMAHRLCLHREDFQIFADPFDSPDEVAFRTRYLREECGMRGEFQYSNQMYVVVGEMIAVLSNKPYQDTMKDLLNEIGMLDSTFIQKTDDFDQMPFRAMPYFVKDGETHRYNPELVKRVTNYASAGALYVTPSDMAKYIRFHLNLGSIDEREIVPREVMEWLRKPSNLGPVPFTYKQSDGDLILNEIGYGLGLVLASYDGWYTIRHGGRMIPYTCILSMYPEKNLGIFTSSSMAPEMLHQQDLHSFIFDLLNGNIKPTMKGMKMKGNIQSDEETANTRIKGDLQILNKAAMYSRDQVDIAGKYGSGSIGTLHVTRKFNRETNQTRYYFQYGRWYTGWMEEITDGEDGREFRLLYDSDAIQDEYAMGLSGDALTVVFDYDGHMTLVQRIENVDYVRAKLHRDFRMETLPNVPWSPSRCE